MLGVSSRSYSFRYPGLLRAEDKAKNSIFGSVERGNILFETARWLPKNWFKNGREIQRRQHGGVLSVELQHPEWLSLRKTLRAQHYSQMSGCFTATIGDQSPTIFTIQLRFGCGGGRKSCGIPPVSMQTGQSTARRSHRALIHAALPPSQTTNINMGAEQPPCRLLPLNPG